MATSEAKTAAKSDERRARSSGGEPETDHPTPDERAERGRSCRSETPRSSHAAWEPRGDRPDPIGLLEEQAAGRVQDLVPIRYGRMSASAFAFYRGAAYVMAADLADTPQTGLRVQLCGDAHLANFGGFASPERQVVFDLNDFDETLPGPWEWDVKRLAGSAAVAGRENGYKTRQRMDLVREMVGEYRQAIREFAEMKTLDVWYARANASEIEELLRFHGTEKQAKKFDKTITKGRRKDSSRAFAKLAVTENGEVRIKSDPPLIVPIRDLVDSGGAQELEHNVHELVHSWSYERSLPGDRRRLLERFRHVDVARKVVGVGSVGTRCWVILLLGRDSDDPLFLQAKETPHSVLERFAGRSELSNQGQRVVEGQRLMQAASDIFLGWLHDPVSLEDPEPRDYYVRQLWDSKTSVDVEEMNVSDMTLYARLCAWTLARAHARSGDPIAIGSYLGSSDVFDRAIAEFAEAYGDQNERDYSALLDAIETGRVKAEQDV